MAGEASSSRQKRQRLVEEEEEGENGGGDVVAKRSGTLFELDLLDCPICFHALIMPIFQCENGHIACSSCCVNMKNKCPVCTLPIGNHRSRIMERVVEAVIVPCPNAKYGCTEKFSYGKELVHEKECRFALCYCPAPGCDYSGVYKDLYIHYHANHMNVWKKFVCGCSTSAWFVISKKSLVLQECPDGPLVVVQCFKEPQGLFVTVNCIAPSAPGIGEFSYHLSYSFGGKTMTIELEKMDRIQKVSFQTPEKDFMLVPYYFQGHGVSLDMYICIRRLQKEAEEESEEEKSEEESDEESEEED